MSRTTKDRRALCLLVCEALRRVAGTVEPVHRVELDRDVGVPDRKAHRTRMSDRQRLMRVTYERQPDILLDRELDENVRRLQIDHADFVDDDPDATTAITYWVVRLAT